jgi:hypothetical protein
MLIDLFLSFVLFSLIFEVSSKYKAEICLDGICDEAVIESAYNNNNNNEVLLKLRPSDLPPPVLFSNWSGPENSTVILPYNNGTAQVVATGFIGQPGLVVDVDTDQFYSSFVVLPEVVPRSTVAQVLHLLRGGSSTPGSTAVPLDMDPDTVDGMTTQEIFLDNDNLRRGEPSKGHYDEDMTAQRTELRQKLRQLLDPILDGKITPYVRKRYAEQCGNDRKGRSCTPCYSLIRR